MTKRPPTRLEATQAALRMQAGSMADEDVDITAAFLAEALQPSAPAQAQPQTATPVRDRARTVPN